MKGDKDTKYMTHQTMFFSDGTQITVEYKPNPNAEQIIKEVSEATEITSLVTVSGDVNEISDVTSSEEVE